MGGLLGLLLGAGQAILRSTLDTRIRTTKDLEQLTEVPVLASIGHRDTAADRAAPDESQWAAAEAYRRLRTNVGFVGLGGERRSSMVITSAVQNEGKTETVVNLARVLAHAGESVLLIDADLRRPQVAARMRLDSELGLSDVLTGRGNLDDLIIDVAAGYLSVLPAGTIPPNPSELLGSEAMSHLLATVERRYARLRAQGNAPAVSPENSQGVPLGQVYPEPLHVGRQSIATRAELSAAAAIQLASGGTSGPRQLDAPKDIALASPEDSRDVSDT